MLLALHYVLVSVFIILLLTACSRNFTQTPKNLGGTKLEREKKTTNITYIYTFKKSWSPSDDDDWWGFHGALKGFSQISHSILISHIFCAFVCVQSRDILGFCIFLAHQETGLARPIRSRPRTRLNVAVIAIPQKVSKYTQLAQQHFHTERARLSNCNWWLTPKRHVALHRAGPVTLNDG